MMQSEPRLSQSQRSQKVKPSEVLVKEFQLLVIKTDL